jgi:hypothetical protein
MSTIQIVGQTCDVCSRQVQVAMDGLYCEQCKIAFHRNHDDGENCPRCQQAAEKDMPAISPNEWPCRSNGSTDSFNVAKVEGLAALFLPPVGVWMAAASAYRHEPKWWKILLLSLVGCSIFFLILAILAMVAIFVFFFGLWNYNFGP